MASSSDSSSSNDAQFGRFCIPEDCIFHRTDSSIAFVNLRPIVPGHVLVMPKRSVPHLRDLDTAEYLDLWLTVRTVQEILEENEYHDAAAAVGAGSHQPQQQPQQYQPLGFNVAVQDGRAAGQSVPHVHVHILPRRAHDFNRNDDVYTHLEEWAPRPTTSLLAAKEDGPVIMSSSSALHVPNDVDRKDRTTAEMAAEAAVYRSCRQRLAGRDR